MVRSHSAPHDTPDHRSRDPSPNECAFRSRGAHLIRVGERLRDDGHTEVQCLLVWLDHVVIFVKQLVNCLPS